MTDRARIVVLLITMIAGAVLSVAGQYSAWHPQYEPPPNFSYDFFSSTSPLSDACIISAGRLSVSTKKGDQTRWRRCVAAYPLITSPEWVLKQNELRISAMSVCAVAVREKVVAGKVNAKTCKQRFPVLQNPQVATWQAEAGVIQANQALRLVRKSQLRVIRGWIMSVFGLLIISGALAVLRKSLAPRRPKKPTHSIEMEAPPETTTIVTPDP